ncbi:MAG TPA: SEC-C metal-binding domain-containing protein [Candidatus Binatia bacterium]|nr:SEC-C metal-binding domain-containing protein [Candidatus Binatia bacterium]
MELRHAHGDGLVDTKSIGWQAPPIRRTTPKLGRNEPCSCGSSKKFKKCCGAA